jgi:hypothetical protein
MWSLEEDSDGWPPSRLHILPYKASKISVQYRVGNAIESVGVSKGCGGCSSVLR